MITLNQLRKKIILHILQGIYEIVLVGVSFTGSIALSSSPPLPPPPLNEMGLSTEIREQDDLLFYLSVALLSCFKQNRMAVIQFC